MKACIKAGSIGHKEGTDVYVCIIDIRAVLHIVICVIFVSVPLRAKQVYLALPF